MAFSSAEGKEFFVEWYRCFFQAGYIKKVLDIGPGAGYYADLIRTAEAGLLQKLAERAVAGSGDWKEVLKVLREKTVIHGIEVFEPYVTRFALRKKYDQIIIDSIENQVQSLSADYDLAIFGDVLDHLEIEIAKKVWETMKQKSRFLWLTFPVSNLVKPWYRGYKQSKEEYAENPNEQVIHCWEYPKLIEELGPFLWQCPFMTVVVLIAEGKRR